MRIQSLVTKLVIAMCVVLVVCIGAPTSLSAANGGVDIVLDPAQSTVPVNSTFDIDIVAECGTTQQINGVDAFLDFDPTYLEVQDVVGGTVLGTPLPGGYDNGAGTIDYSAGTFAEPPPECSIIVATITFMAKAATAGTDIGFHTDVPRTTNVVLGGTSVLNSTTGATITITPPLIISCNPTGLELNAFTPGMSVYIKGSGLVEGDYQIWIADNPVGEGDALSQSEGSTQQITIDSSGSFGPIAIWAIPWNASPDYNEYDIVVDRIGSGEGSYNPVDNDGIDSIQEVGFVAPTPEFPSLVLMMIGLVGLAGCTGFGVSRRRSTHITRPSNDSI